ncbi:MAG: copper-binding protein [Rhodanobacter sp.]|jgi:Cu(I)/Ag(I) efflux system protein CusF|nr:copper-binding protein [Rhodanobacter sp.]
MKKPCITLAIAAALIATPVFANPQQMDPNMPGMAGMHEATPADVQGVGVVKAVDTAKNTITLQHEAIAAIGWPAMTMPFKVASPELLKHVKVGDKVQFTFRQASTGSTVTAIRPAR